MKRRAIALSLAAACVAWFPRTAAADDRAYPAEILAVDVLGAGTGVVTYFATSSWRETADDPPGLPAYLATSMYGVGAIGSPAVHWAHGRTGVGFAAMGMRMTLPPVVGLGGLLVHCIARETKSPCAQDGMTAGMLIGDIAAGAVDALIFAGPSAAPKEPRRVTHWYGWQTLGVDAVLLGVGIGLAQKPRETEPGKYEYSDVLATAVGWYAFSWLTVPFVHVAHGKPLRGLADSGLRIGVPAVAVLPGVLGACGGLGGRDGCTNAGAEGGLLGGMMLVAAVDAVLLARETEPARASTAPDTAPPGAAPPPPAAPDPTTTWVPYLGPAPRGMSEGMIGGVAGTF